MVERRRSPLRRQLNEALLSADGTASASKLVAIGGQLVVLYYVALHFDALLERWDTLLVLLTFVIAPDICKKLISARYASRRNGR